MAVDVNALSQEAAHNAKFVGVSDPGPFAHPDSQNICADTTDYSNDVRSYICGMPAIGKAYGPGELDSQGAVSERGYASPAGAAYMRPSTKKSTRVIRIRTTDSTSRSRITRT